MVKKKLPPLGFVKKNRQLLFGVILIIVIPSLVVLNTSFFYNRFKLTFESELQDRATTVGDIISALISEKIDNPKELESAFTRIKENSSEILLLEIYRPVGADLFLWASTEDKEIGLRETEGAAFLAWQKNYPIASPSQSKDESTRFWTVNYPLENALGERALLKINLTTETINKIAKNLLFQSFLLLIAVLFIIMLLLLVNSRLFQYAILYRKLRELDKAKDDFISIASHELRTPITAMSGFFSMLADGSYGKISKKTKESVLFMSANVGRLQSLVEDLLNVSKLQQGKMKMDVEKCDVEKIIEETVRSLTPNAAKKKLSLKKDLQKNIFVNTDHDRLKQVLINLIGNSIKYTKKGKVTVTLTSEKGKAKIVVKDTGIGMSSSEQERLFEKFYRAQNTKTADIEGTGLGLWITKAIVELMGGKIYVNSIENTGTQVTVTIPLVITGK